MIRLLLIAEDTSQVINKNYYYLEQELEKVSHLVIWRRSGHIDRILKSLPWKPDFILLLNDMSPQLSPLIKGLGPLNIPTGLFINDVHRLTKIRENYISKHKINHLFIVGWGQSVQTYPQFKHKMHWFPHFVNPEIYKDYRLTRDIQLLMLGAVNDYYPLRQKIRKAYTTDDRFVYHNHPGYRSFSSEEEKKILIGKSYARELNRAAIFFTCPSILFYPVMKYFEALACRTLLLAPTFKELEDLGFVPGKHFIAIDEDNFQEQATYYLSKPKEREEIVNQGYEFIRKTHTVGIRAKQLINQIEDILNHH